MARQIRPFSGPDGTNWGVEVQVPGASNAMIVFHHPGGKTARLDRYAWDIWSGPESRSVTSRVTTDKIMQSLTEEKLQLLFRRSMPVSNPRPLVDRGAELGRAGADVVGDVSFAVRAGQVLGLVGESGSGKTVTALSILRIVPRPGKVVGGKALFEGQDLLSVQDRIQAQHGLFVADFRQFAQRGSPHSLGRRIGRDQVRMSLFQFD